MTSLNDYDTPEALRAFLKLCLDPGHGIRRSPEKLAEVLPEPLAGKTAEFAPHLKELRHVAQALDEQARKAFREYADALAAWVNEEEPKTAPVTLARECYGCGHVLNWHTSKGWCTFGECTCNRFRAERYVIGRNGVFATLYDWQEHRLVVENATEEHCRKVRDELLATEGRPCVKSDEPAVSHIAWAKEHLYVEPDDPKPAPAASRSMPLMEAVSVAYDAATAHASQCGTCWPDMRLAEMCPDGQRAAIASLDAIPAVDCAHDEEDEVRTVAGLDLHPADQ
ncbi:hypothetical protein ACFY8S_01765 [Streptomyces hygroscopicus]|uniref:hypothetical protein n=1 Tax=Streptomyces hygroscopicus TaxID=1912 RepID=UPI0036B98C6D